MKLLRHDLLKHFFAGFLIFFALQWIDSLLALITVVLIGIGKELLWDWAWGKGTPEIIDAVYTIVPAALMYLIINL